MRQLVKRDFSFSPSEAISSTLPVSFDENRLIFACFAIEIKNFYLIYLENYAKTYPLG